ncbi:dihydroorotate dehydrogenase [Cytobacillus sp. FJAT-54145]|uniref:Dihydroorotate dehydrogenase n=1 Tax=Cytobacillus spartinae TaxID=3299023 RepID=A0ABW6KFX7_9BACI
MPDWSYHPLFKSWLTKLPNALGREFIHNGMSLIASSKLGSSFIEFLGHMDPSPKLQKEFLNIHVSNPIGLSGKIDPLMTGTKAFAQLGFGFIEIGPVALQPYRSPASYDSTKQNILFPLKLETLGIEQTILKLKKLQSLGKPIFIRVSPDHSLLEQSEIIKALHPYCDTFIIEDKDEFTSNCLSLIKKAAKEKPLLLSIKQKDVRSSLIKISRYIKDTIVDGIVIEENSVMIGDFQLFETKQVDALLESLIMLRKNEITSVPIIISGGVLEPEDAKSLLSNGADLIILSSGYVVSGPGLPKRVNELLLMDQEDSDKEIVDGWQYYWLFGLCILIGGILALLFSMTRVILPYDEAFLNLSRDQLMMINNRIILFMAHDRMTLAGTMISGGIIYMQLAKHGVRNGVHWARKAINIAGITGFIGILLFIGYGYFDWLHGLFWVILLPFFVIGYKKTTGASHTPLSMNLKNSHSWKRSLWGQLCFVTLGFSFVIGGVVISAIGISSVFVNTDLTYICMTPELMDSINSRLIPLIAHDRAGFGSALISVGLLVLMMALWGFHEGARWIWKTFLIGGIPAFSAGILTHFIIGYTTFIHLLPAYFALALYLLGLYLSKDFLTQKS